VRRVCGRASHDHEFSFYRTPAILLYKDAVQVPNEVPTPLSEYSEQRLRWSLFTLYKLVTRYEAVYHFTVLAKTYIVYTSH
jgi:cellulose synthase/poly-beta-1,6-N-acetylglucosamine synthase-like glycosyltransferase